ncbi:hypothetical protein C8R48DRAFT_726361 [Suillus tomentosus]|nr:hypothetical protein C8R48DRAFT_726361 [Suillus tomentosus]
MLKWKLMLMPLQWVVPTLIPLQMHSSLAFLLPHRFPSDSGEATELPQPSRSSAFHPHVLFARLSSFIHCSLRDNNAPDALQQPFMPCG